MTSPRPLVALLLVHALAAPCLAQAPAFTRLRHGHDLRILCDGQIPAEVTIHCISASLGYTDAASFEAFGPEGETLCRGSVPPGESRQVTLAPGRAGCCLLSVDPLRNAFGVEIEGADWVVDVSDDNCIDVISRSRPLRLWVPPGLRRLPLRLAGEAATVRVLQPDGSRAAEVVVPQYGKVTTEVNVPESADGGFWTLELKLAEDLAIGLPWEVGGLVADYPISLEAYTRLRGMGSLATFDHRPAAPEALQWPKRPVVAHTLQAGDLAVDFSSTGAAVGARSGWRNLTPRDINPIGGFVARDVGRGSGFVALEGGVAQTEAGLRVYGDFPGLDLSVVAALQSRDAAIEIAGVLADHTGSDRAISLYFIVPLAARGWRWHEDGQTSRRILDRGLYTTAAPCAAGANGLHSSYPLACVGGRAAVALAVDPMRPRIFRLGYEAATQQLYCAQDLGLCAEHKATPSAATFGMALYPVDPEWGFRAATERYWELYPQAFEKRMARHGGWICWGNMDKVAEPEKTGMLYHWGPATTDKGRAVAHDDGIGTCSFIYNDSVRFFMDLGFFEQRPTAEEAREPFRRFLQAEDPLGLLLDAPQGATGRSRWQSLRTWLGERDLGQYTGRCQAAVQASFAEDAEGAMIPGYLVNRKDWGPENWWTGRLLCNPDPDIPGGYGRFLMEDVIGLVWDYLKANGADPDGIGLDNYLVNANTLNYRREHFRYADIPLTFDRSGKLALCGDFQLLEWVRSLKDWLKTRDGYLIPNAVGRSWPFLAPYMDIFGLELAYETEAAQLYYATLAAGRPVVTLPLSDAQYEKDWVQMHLAFGMMPGGYASGGPLTQPGSEYRALLSRYMPVLQAMSLAGWRPVTKAEAGTERIGVERFGPGEDGALLYSIRNRTEDRVRGEVRFDLAGLGLPEPQKLRLRDALSAEVLASVGADGVATVTVELGPKDVSAVRVAP